MQVFAVRSQNSAGEGPRLKGSAVLVGPRWLITCAHVLTGYPWLAEPQKTGGPIHRIEEMAGPMFRVGNTEVVSAYVGSSNDLALLQTRTELPYDGLNLGVSWQVPELFAYGYSDMYPTVINRQGPLAVGPSLVVNGNSQCLPAEFGLPEGFSGGPWAAAVNGESHVVGISWLGGVGRATSLAIAATCCSDFLEQAQRRFGLEGMSWTITDPTLCLAQHQLASLIHSQRHQLKARVRDPDLSYSVWPRQTQHGTVFEWLDNVADSAIGTLKRGALPNGVCFCVDAARLLPFLEHRDVSPSSSLRLLSSFLAGASRPCDSHAFIELIERLIAGGRVNLLFFGDRRLVGRHILLQPEVSRLLRGVAVHLKSAPAKPARI